MSVSRPVAVAFLLASMLVAGLFVGCAADPGPVGATAWRCIDRPIGAPISPEDCR